MRPEIVKGGLNEIPVKDVHMEWRNGFLKWKLYESLSCSRGAVRSLATVYRTSEAAGEIYNETVYLQTSLGIRVLVFSFQSCDFEIKVSLIFDISLLTLLYGGLPLCSILVLQYQPSPYKGRHLGRKSPRVQKLYISSIL